MKRAFYVRSRMPRQPQPSGSPSGQALCGMENFKALEPARDETHGWDLDISGVSANTESHFGAYLGGHVVLGSVLGFPLEGNVGVDTISYEPGFSLDLVSVTMSSWGNDIN